MPRSNKKKENNVDCDLWIMLLCDELYTFFFFPFDNTKLVLFSAIPDIEVIFSDLSHFPVCRSL